MHPFNFLEDFFDGKVNDVVPHRCRHTESADVCWEAEAGGDAIGIALVFADILRQPRGKAAAQDFVHDLYREGVQTVAFGADAADDKFGLGAARAVYQIDAGFRLRRQVGEADGLRAAFPISEKRLGQGCPRFGCDGAGDNENSVVGLTARLIEADNIVAGNGLQRFKAGGHAIGMLAIKQFAEGAPGDKTRLGQTGFQTAHGRLELPFNFSFGEISIERHIA